MNSERLDQNSDQDNELMKKESNWEEKLKAVNKLADGLGLGVDEGIKETVAAFHIFKINTTASHEGKIDRHPIPYIDVEAVDTKELRKKFRKIEGEDEETEKERDILREEITRKNLEERKKIIPLLEEFYADRKVPYEIRLGIDSLAMGWSRIQSLGADFQKIEKDKELKRQKLQQFQDEMRAFTEFLKKKYFAQ